MNEWDGNWEEAGNREGINTEFHAYNTYLEKIEAVCMYSY